MITDKYIEKAYENLYNLIIGNFQREDAMELVGQLNLLDKAIVERDAKIRRMTDEAREARKRLNNILEVLG